MRQRDREGPAHTGLYKTRQRLGFILSATGNHWRVLNSVVSGAALVLWGECIAGGKNTPVEREHGGPEGGRWWPWRRCGDVIRF